MRQRSYMIKFRKFCLHHKGLVITLTAIVAVVVIFVLMCVSTYIPKTADTDYSSEACRNNPYIVETALISAHRAGRNIAPENTMAAFKACFENNNDYSVDILEFDLHITKDKKLILLHDETLDRTSDCREVYNENDVRPQDKTVAELKRYNMGYHFTVNNQYIYRGEAADLSYCRIVTLNEVLDYLRSQESVWKKQFNYIIEIKNDGDLGNEAADILYDTLVSYRILDRTIVGTFNGSVSDYLDEKHPDIIRSAGIMEVLDFYFSCMFNVDLAKKNVKYSVLQIPYKDFAINLGKKSIIDYAHKYGIAVQYWTINSEKDIRYLTSIGADAIISDDPRLTYQVINQLK